jgi:hypothetical protein
MMPEPEEEFEKNLKNAINFHKGLKKEPIQLSLEVGECTGRQYCEICIKWTSSWANNLDLALCPTLFLKCWASVDGTEQSKGAYDWSKKK